MAPALPQALRTAQFEYGAMCQAYLPMSLYNNTLIWSGLLHTLPMALALFQALMT